MLPRQHEAVRRQLRFHSHHGGKYGGGRSAANLDSAAVAVLHAPVAAARRAHGCRVLRHATARLGMTQQGRGQGPELKQEEERAEELHDHAIVALVQQLDKVTCEAPGEITAVA